MKTTIFFLVTNALVLAAMNPSNTINPFPIPFSSTFQEPSPPLIQTEFTANYMQLKYDDTGINHPVTGFAFFSPSAKKIRLDGTDGTIFNSIFDFNNITANGEVSNRQLTFINGVKSSQTTCFSEFVVPAEPLFTSDMLNTSGAVFIGIQEDALYGPLNAWQFTFPVPPPQLSALVTAFLDSNNTLVRFDFSVPGPLRTFATTRFFNIVIGPVDPIVFQSDCQ